MSRPVRRSQAVSPFGVGALVDFPGPVSLIHAGLDAWPFDERKPEHGEFKVEDEPRLARRLGVDFFVQPPDFRQAERGSAGEALNLGLRLPFLRFPLWHSCPRCGRMFETRYHDRSAPRCAGPIGTGTDKGKPHKPRSTVQVRFVAACRAGHMRDFPFVEWLGLDRGEWGRIKQDRWLRLLSTGSASVAGVVVVAERQTPGGFEEVKRRPLGGAFGVAMDIVCDGQIPALGIGDGGDSPENRCGMPLQTVLRGASNLYFSDVRSAIYVPEIDDGTLPQDLLDLLDDHDFKQDLINVATSSDTGLLTKKSAGLVLKRRYPESMVEARALADAANRHLLHEALTSSRLTAALLVQKSKLAEDRRLTSEMIADVISASPVSEWSIDPELLVEQINRWIASRSGGEGAADDPMAAASGSEGAFRFEEYSAFCRDGREGVPKLNLVVRSHRIEEYDQIVRGNFSRIALLDKLRETRAFLGYSRLYAVSQADADARWALISRQRKNWLPAVVVRGEGIFLVFERAKLDTWDSEHGAFHKQRFERVNRTLHEEAQRRQVHARQVSPQFVLLHTFAHILISQLTFDCGYGSASLRERIYFSEDHPRMAGVLIYTAAGDSEGTMGGLVRMGSPGLFERTLARAIDRARWCSSDPVCIESPGQGPNNCNLAACHSCTLLPETSCEQQNRLLDRGVLIGTLDRSETGFFAPV